MNLKDTLERRRRELVDDERMWRAQGMNYAESAKRDIARADADAAEIVEIDAVLATWPEPSHWPKE